MRNLNTELLGKLFTQFAYIVFASMLTVTATASNLSTSSLGANSTIAPIIQLLLLDDDADPNLPVANAGSDAQVLLGELVKLDGSASSDPNQLPITYLWSFVSKPAGSAATLNFTNIADPEFVLDLPGQYIVQLVVNNGTDDSLPDTVTISNTNRAPIADAGDNKVELLNNPIQLNGNNSSDIDTDPLTFSWSFSQRPDGSAASLDDPAAATPTFTPDVAGNYILELIVNDGKLDSEPDQIEVLAGAALTLNVDDVFFGLGRQTSATLQLNFPAPSQGITAELNLNNSIINLSQSQLEFSEGETEKSFTLTGQTAGLTTLSASATNVVGDSKELEVSAALISVSEIDPLSPTATKSVAISLSDAAPIGGVTVNLEVLDENIATVTPQTVSIAEGAFVPTNNPQITGAALGTTKLRASATGFAPDERDITVALAASFNLASLNVPEQLTREIILELDAPAPTGGIEFSLSSSGTGQVTVQNSVTVEEGQLQSLPIVLTGITEGSLTLTASTQGFLDATATINVVDAPDVFLAIPGSSSHLAEAVIGHDLQLTTKMLLQITPTSAVDVHVSVPADSGVLLSTSQFATGSSSVIFEDVLTSQVGLLTIQGVEIGDDVPLTIKAYKANTMETAGYEAKASTIDVDPSGLFVSTSDFTVNAFTPNRTISVQTALLGDEESPNGIGNLVTSMPVRSGITLTAEIEVADSNIVALPNGATNPINIAPNSSQSSLPVSPLSSGVTSVSIKTQPEGFTAPADRSDSVEITVLTPNAYLSRIGTNSHTVEAAIGLNLQDTHRITLGSPPPTPVDIRITVPNASGVLLSASATQVGGNQLIFEGVTAANSPFFYIQGVTLGDDVPLTIDVFNANTTIPAGYNALTSTVDVDPTGVFTTSSDYTTTTFSNNRLIQFRTALLYDNENPADVNKRRRDQVVRGGFNLTVPLEVGSTAIAKLPNGANDNITITGGVSLGNIAVEPIGAGQTTISAIPPASNLFTIPVNLNGEVTVTVTAPNAFLRSITSASHQAEAIVGIDLQTSHYVRLAATPPSPVDVKVSVPINSGVLLSKDPTLEGATEILYEDITSTETPLFLIQGTSIGDNVPITIEVFDANTTNLAGYNSLTSTVDVDPSGVFINTANISTTTFSNNSSVTLLSATLYDDESPDLENRTRSVNEVRGGVSLQIPLSISDDTVAALPSGANDTLTINAGTSENSIEIDPLTAGTATLSITAQPTNFILPVNGSGEIAVNVAAPQVRFNSNEVNVGDELQTQINVTLETAPPSPVGVTVEVSSSLVALVSKDSNISGASSITFNNVTGTNVGSVFVQGITKDTATQLKGSAPGFSDKTISVNVKDSGFYLTSNTATVSAGSTRNLTIRSAMLRDNGALHSTQAVRGGASFDIDVTSSAPEIGTVTSPITISNGDFSAQTQFHALTPGATIISIEQPAGFIAPAGKTETDVTVN